MAKKKKITEKAKKKGVETQHIWNMSGGAGKRAKPVEKAPAADKALHEGMHLLPQRLPNVASVDEKRSLEPDYENFDYELEKQKLEIREKNLALYKQEQQAKLEVVKQEQLAKQKQADIEHQKVHDAITSRIFGLN